MAIQLSVLARNAGADGITTQVGAAGKLRIFTGAVPVDCAAASTGTLLSEHTLGSPFAPAAASGALAPTLPANATAVATGTAGYYRVLNAAGTVCVKQGLCATSGSDLNLNTLSIVTGGPVQINSWTLTMGGA
jgi:hypothetical protein